MIEDVRLLARSPRGIRNFRIKFRYLRAKLLTSALNTNMPININTTLAKISITPDMIKVPFRVKHKQPVRRTSNRCVSINRGCGSRISARINNKSGFIASNETSVHSPRRQIPQTSYCEAPRRKEHGGEVRIQKSEFRIRGKNPRIQN